MACEHVEVEVDDKKHAEFRGACKACKERMISVHDRWLSVHDKSVDAFHTATRHYRCECTETDSLTYADIREPVPCRRCSRRVTKAMLETLGELRTCLCGAKTREQFGHCGQDERPYEGQQIADAILARFPAAEFSGANGTGFSTATTGPLEHCLAVVAQQPLIQRFHIERLPSASKPTEIILWLNCNTEPVASAPDADGICHFKPYYDEKLGGVVHLE